MRPESSAAIETALATSSMDETSPAQKRAAPPRRANRRRGGFAGFHVDVHERHAGALFRKALADGAADAVRRARDDRDLPSSLFIARAFWCAPPLLSTTTRAVLARPVQLLDTTRAPARHRRARRRTMMHAASKTPSVPALLRGLAILERIAKSRRGLTFAQLTRHFDFPKSSVHALLLTFEREGYLQRDARHRALHDRHEADQHREHDHRRRRAAGEGGAVSSRAGGRDGHDRPPGHPRSRRSGRRGQGRSRRPHIASPPGLASAWTFTARASASA